MPCDSDLQVQVWFITPAGQVLISPEMEWLGGMREGHFPSISVMTVLFTPYQQCWRVLLPSTWSLCICILILFWSWPFCLGRDIFLFVWSLIVVGIFKNGPFYAFFWEIFIPVICLFCFSHLLFDHSVLWVSYISCIQKDIMYLVSYISLVYPESRDLIQSWLRSSQYCWNYHSLDCYQPGIGEFCLFYTTQCSSSHGMIVPRTWLNGLSSLGLQACQGKALG